MFKRFRGGLFRPVEIHRYVNDKGIFTALYFFFLVFIMIIPQIIYTFTTPVVSYEDTNMVREVFFNSNEPIPFTISNGLLLNDNNDDEIIYNIPVSSSVLVSIKSNNDSVRYREFPVVVELSKSGVFLYQYGFRQFLFSYSDYSELNGMKLNLACENNDHFWNVAFGIIRTEAKKIAPVFRTIDIVLSIIVNGVYICLFSFILTLFNRSGNRKNVKFSKFWQMVIYLMTPYAVGSILADVFGLALIYYVGLIWSMVNVIRFSQFIGLRGDINEL